MPLPYTIDPSVTARLMAGVLVATTALVLPAQQALDADLFSMPATSWTRNADHSPISETGRFAAHSIRDRQTISNRTIRISHSSGRCDLVVEGDGHLRLTRCLLQVEGSIYLKDRGNLELVDSRVELLNTYPRQFNYWWEGGHLRTTRCSLGGRKANGINLASNFWVHRGLWTANDTTIQYSSGILLGEGRAGFRSLPFLRGGSLVADGLHQGENSDALIMSGAGDAVLRNSDYNIHLFLYADNDQPFTTSLDLDTQRRIGYQVYGDATVHDAPPSHRLKVTKHIPRLPYRLEIQDVRVPFWFVTAFGVRNASANGAYPATYVLENTNGVIVSVQGMDLTGSPATVGPWSNHYASPPQLPAAEAPGEHELPPGCGVRIGNVTFQAPPGAWARIDSWGIYLRGSATDLQVRGPTKIAELHMREGKCTVEGTEQYNARLVANSIDLHRDAQLTLKGVSVGGFGLDQWTQCQVGVSGVATCRIENAMVQSLLFRSEPEANVGPYFGIDAGTIGLKSFVERNAVREQRSGNATFSVERAASNESFDLQNLDFEKPLQSSTIPYHWRGSGVTGAVASHVRPGSAGQRSLQYKSAAATGGLRKDVILHRGCRVQMSAWLRAQQVPSGAWLRLRLEGAGGGGEVTPTLVANQWIQVRTPIHEVQANDTSIGVRIDHGGVSSGALDVLIDDLDVNVAPWWDSDNLANLDFEAGQARSRGYAPRYFRAPDHWGIWAADARVETSDLRPGAAAGSKSVALDVRGGEVQLTKALSFLAPGQTMTVTGWVKGIPKGSSVLIKLHVGDGATWWDQLRGNNRHVATTTANRRWEKFTLTYVAPANPTVTWMGIVGGATGDVILVDDVEVTIR